jgi:GPI mannosyltransferase 3
MAEPLPSSPPEPAAAPALEVIPPGQREATRGFPSDRSRIAWWLVAPFALAPILLAVLQLGRWHPDEVYQFLEPAWFRVHGYGIRAWEWQVGLRNWAVPLVFASFLELGRRVGIDHPLGYRALIALPQLLLHVAMLAATYRYVERRVGRRGIGGASLGFILVASFAPVLYLSGRTMGESLSAALLILASDALDGEDRPYWRGAAGGALLGCATVVRYGSAAFVLGALLWIALRGRWRLLAAACFGGAGVAGGLGILDWLTWGKPFHSVLAYLDFNVFSGQAAQRFGAQPPTYYLPLLAVWVAPWAWPGVAMAWKRERFVPLPAFASVAYLVALSATPHKEERFLYPALVLLALAGAPGVVWLVDGIRAVSWRALAIAAALASGALAWVVMPDVRGDQFRAQVNATRDPSVTGLLIVNEGRWGSGGYFYIGRNIPWYNCDFPQQALHIVAADRRVNRVITFEDRAIPELQSAGFQIVDRIGRETILARDVSGR